MYYIIILVTLNDVTVLLLMIIMLITMKLWSFVHILHHNYANIQCREGRGARNWCINTLISEYKVKNPPGKYPGNTRV